MRRIFLMVFLLVASANATINTWVGDVNASPKNAANWTGDAFPGATDTILFSSAGNTNCTFDSAFSVGAFIVRSSYTATLNLSTYNLTVAGICSVGTGGTYQASDSIIQTGDANFLLVGSGTITIDNQTIDCRGTGTITCGNGGKNPVAVVCAYSGKTSTINWSNSAGGGPKRLILKGGSLTFATSSFVLKPNTSCIPLVVAASTINDNGLGIQIIPSAGTYDTIQAMTMAGSLWFSFRPGEGSTPQTGDQVGNLTIVPMMRIIQTAGTGTPNYYNTNGFSIKCKQLVFGSNVAGKTLTMNCGASAITIGTDGFTSTANNAGSDTINAGTSTWIDSGSYLVGSNARYTHTSDAMTFYNTAKATITTAGQNPFYNVTFASTAGIIDTLTDSGYCVNNFTLTSGKLKGLSNGGTVGGNMTLGGTDTTFGRLASAKWWDFPNISTWQRTGTGVALLDSTKWRFKVGGSFLTDSNIAIGVLKLVKGKLALKSGTTLTLKKNTAGDFSGADGSNLDSLVSSSAGNYTRLYFGVQPNESNLYLKDVAAQNMALPCTTNCFNGGNDSNVVWDTLVVDSLRAAGVTVKNKISTAGGSCTLYVAKHGRTAGGSAGISGGDSWTINSQTATKWILTATARAAGAVDVVYQSGLGLDPGDDTLSVTYQAAPDISYTTPVVDTVSKAASHAVTNAGGAVDSFTVSGTALPGGLSLTKATGLISGTPTTVSNATDYKIVAWSVVGNDTATINITVIIFPNLTTLKHPMGRVGYVDTIVGSGFYATGGTATLGGTSVTISRQTNDTLIWTVPTKAKGTYNWIFVNSAGLKDTVSFRVLVPTITITNP